MNHSAHTRHAVQGHAAPSLNRTAWSATLHCLTGCAIGEVLGMVIGTSLGWGNGATIALAVVLAFFFGYALTLLPLLKAMSFGAASSLRSRRTRRRSPSWRSSTTPSCSSFPAPWTPGRAHCSSGAASVFRSPLPPSRPSRSTGGLSREARATPWCMPPTVDDAGKSTYVSPNASPAI